MIFRPAVFFIAAVAVCALRSGAAAAATAPGITPTADTFVSSANPAGAYGSAGALEVSAPGLSKGEFDTFVRFNLASTKTYFDGLYGAGKWTVQSITLQLTASAPNNAIFNSPNVAGMFTLTSLQSAQADTWVEGTGSPNAPDTTAGTLNYNNHTNYLSASADQGAGTFAFAGGTSGATTYTLTLAGGLLANVQAGADTNLYFSAADTAVSSLFNSGNFGTATARPILTVSAVPEPGVAAICGLVAGCLAVGMARRRWSA